MAHNLMKIGDKHSMMAVGERPWHGLGVLLTDPPTTAEAIKLAGLDWKVRKIQLVAPDGDQQILTDRYGIIRDTKEKAVLGVVGKDYSPLQNVEAFEFFDPVLKSGHVTIETAGALGEGERVWVMVRVKAPFEIARGDMIEPFLLLSNGHDGMGSVQVKFTPIRVVCQNTLMWALEDGEAVRIRHDRSMRSRVREAQMSVDFILRHFKNAAKHFAAMARANMTEESLVRYLRAALPDPRKPSEESYDRRLQVVREQRLHASELYENGTGNAVAGVRGTLWAAYNGLTELADHHMAFRNGDKLDSIWFGAGSRLKHRALVEASKLMASSGVSIN